MEVGGKQASKQALWWPEEMEAVKFGFRALGSGSWEAGCGRKGISRATSGGICGPRSLEQRAKAEAQLSSAELALDSLSTTCSC